MLKLKHQDLKVYQAARELCKECHVLALQFPKFEMYGLSLQLRRAANSVKHNIAEGASRKSNAERKRFYEIARGSVVELDAGFETAVDVNYISESDVTRLAELLNICFAMLSNMIKATPKS